ncbi:hypothetical protein D0Y65_031468, partial [Glycine soja]
HGVRIPVKLAPKKTPEQIYVSIRYLQQKPRERMANASLHQLALFMFLFMVASGLTQQASARGDQCKTNKDCVPSCAHRPHCPVLCLGGYCLCNCGSAKVHIYSHI